jgi:endo-1,4-beta-xylanase
LGRKRVYQELFGVRATVKIESLGGFDILMENRPGFAGKDLKMKKYGIFVGLICVFGGIITAFGAGASDELEAKAIEARIREHRMGDLIIKAEPGAEVHVEQLRHEFWFGAALSSGAFSGRMNDEDQRKYEETFLANFNAAVTENALKWHDMERRQGEVNYRVVDAILAWTDKHQIPLRGHNIFWGIPNRVQTWLKAMDDATLRETLKARALDIGRRYRGRFAEYDLNNEMIHANYYADRLGPDITKQMADWIKQADPDAKLYFNDYDILTGKRLDDYIEHIRGLLEQGAPMAGIGVQGHLHGENFDPKALQHALNELAKIGLPIRITEFNMPGQRSVFMQQQNLKLTPEQEQTKAKAITEYYRICFAHPAVEGILMWGFWEGANWIRQSSLYRRDWTPTPAAEAYRDLVFKEWWTDSKVKADANGQCRVRAFYGKYAVTSGDQTKEVLLSKEKGQVTVSFE